MGPVLAAIGAVLFLAGALFYAGALPSSLRTIERETQAGCMVGALGLVVLVLALVPIPGVTR